MMTIFNIMSSIFYFIPKLEKPLEFFRKIHIVNLNIEYIKIPLKYLFS